MNLQALSGDCKLTTITSRHVDLYKAQRLQVVAPTSVNVELRALRTIFNIAMRWNLLEVNPLSKMQLLRVPENTPTFFTRNDCRKFVETVGTHCIKDVFLFAVMTGLRRGEILNLRWAVVRMEDKMVHIQSSETYRVK